MSITEIEEATQHLTFKLDEEVFALDISKVREVLEYTTVTKVPQTPEFMLGVINLRGHVVPVIDMRLKFGMSGTDKTVNTCIIIVEINVEGESTVLGAMADSVQEVFELEDEQIEPPPMPILTELAPQRAKSSKAFFVATFPAIMWMYG